MVVACRFTPDWLFAATVERAFMPAMTAFLRASSGDAATNGGMAALKGCSTVGVTTRPRKSW
jgi:hypothetical protein